MNNSSTTTHERISQDMTMEMSIAGSKDLPIHIDTDIEDDSSKFRRHRKQFRLTDEKKRMIAQEFDERRQLYKIRKIRKQERKRSRQIGEEERRASQEWKRFLDDLPTELIVEVIRHTHHFDLQDILLGDGIVRQSLEEAERRWKLSLPRLPAELILEVIRHTRLADLQNLLRSGRAIHNVFRDNQAAVTSGIEAAQFPEFRWLFGSGRQRSREQKQAFKDYIGTHLLLNDPSKIPETFDKIEKGEFADWSAVRCLRNVQDELVDDVSYHKSMGIDLERQSALCLRMWSTWEQHVEEANPSQRPWKDQRLGVVREVTLVRAMPMEARLRLFERQAAPIQANIRDVLVTKIIVVMRILDAWPLEPGELGDHPLMGQETSEWIARYYSPENVGRKMKQDSMALWIAKLAAGYILETMIPAQPWHGEDLLNIADNIRFENGFFKEVLAREFMISGSTDRLWKQSREFAELIGLNFGRILEGTAVGEYLDKLT